MECWPHFCNSRHAGSSGHRFHSSACCDTVCAVSSRHWFSSSACHSGVSSPKPNLYLLLMNQEPCLFLGTWLSFLTSIISWAAYLKHSGTSFCPHQVQACLCPELPPHPHQCHPRPVHLPNSVLNYQKRRKEVCSFQISSHLPHSPQSDCMMSSPFHALCLSDVFKFSRST